MRLITILVMFLALPGLPALAEDSTMVTLKASQIGEIFCLSRVGNDTGPIEGLLTESLRSAIADADQQDASWEKQNPGEKPPLGDGIPWQAWPDYAASCKVGPLTLSKTDARVEIKYGFPEDPKADFVDTLLLKMIDQPGQGTGFWRIDNIAYATGSDLKAELLAAFTD